MNLKRRIEGLEERLGFREQPLGGTRLRSKKKVCAPPLL